MPTYVYKFIDTGDTIEVQQSFSDDSLTEAVHPVTGETLPVKKVFTPVGVTFKGGGFYKTDSRGGASKSSTAASTSGTSGDGGTSTSSSSSDSSSSTSSAPSTPAPASTPSPASSSISSASSD